MYELSLWQQCENIHICVRSTCQYCKAHEGTVAQHRPLFWLLKKSKRNNSDLIVEYLVIFIHNSKDSEIPVKQYTFQFLELHKMLSKLAKEPGCEELAEWIRPCENYLYWRWEDYFGKIQILFQQCCWQAWRFRWPPIQQMCTWWSHT